MKIEINVYNKVDPEVLAHLEVLSRKMDLIISKEMQIMSAIDDVLTQAEAAAQANSDAEDAAEALLHTLVQMITDLKAASTDPATLARITALADTLRARAAQLSAAVVAGTPAAPTP